MSIDWQNILFNFLGGLGLFLYSIKTMGDGLQQAAGDRLRYYIDKYTSNPFLGVLVGIVVTALIQSSTGVTVITVGLVSAGLLTLRQAIGIIMGPISEQPSLPLSLVSSWELMPCRLCLSVPSAFSLPRIGWRITLVESYSGLGESFMLLT